jgi:hypothetical protein
MIVVLGIALIVVINFAAAELGATIRTVPGDTRPLSTKDSKLL